MMMMMMQSAPGGQAQGQGSHSQRNVSGEPRAGLGGLVGRDTGVLCVVVGVGGVLCVVPGELLSRNSAAFDAHTAGPSVEQVAAGTCAGACMKRLNSGAAHNAACRERREVGYSSGRRAICMRVQQSSEGVPGRGGQRSAPSRRKPCLMQVGWVTGGRDLLAPRTSRVVGSERGSPCSVVLQCSEGHRWVGG